MMNYIRFNPSDACIFPNLTKREIKPLDEQDTARFLSQQLEMRLKAGPV